ncbi:MAG: glutathione S-transferase family protein [Nannocystales bacterium]
MKLHIAHGSPNCRKVLAVIAQLGLDVEMVVLDPAVAEQKRPAFLEINPNGKVPALEDGELRLWESDAIMAYLCTKHGRTSLYPEDPAARADVTRWLCWDLAHFGNHLATTLFERVFKPFAGAGEPDEDVVRRSLEAFGPYAQVLDDTLRDRAFVCGESVTIADFALASQLGITRYGRVDLAPYPNIRAWMRRLDEEPGWSATAIPGPMQAQLDTLFGARASLVQSGATPASS